MEFEIVLFLLKPEERKIMDIIKKVKRLKKDEDVLRLGLLEMAEKLGENGTAESESVLVLEEAVFEDLPAPRLILKPGDAPEVVIIRPEPAPEEILEPEDTLAEVIISPGPAPEEILEPGNALEEVIIRPGNAREVRIISTRPATKGILEPENTSEEVIIKPGDAPEVVIISPGSYE